MLDITDKKLINLLQNDSKQTTKQLSLQLNLSVVVQMQARTVPVRILKSLHLEY